MTNVGAYRKQSGNLSGTDFYQIPNFRKIVKPVHTNTVVGANYRAPAYPQSVFGFASFLDQIAHELGINPSTCSCATAFRNTKARFPSPRTISRSASSRGRSASAGAKNGISPAPWAASRSTASAWRWVVIHSGRAWGRAIRVNPDGTAHLLVGVTDIGTGASTMAIIAAEALGIPLNQIQVTNGDTDVTPARGRVGQPYHAVYRPGSDRRGGGCAPASFRARRRTVKGEGGVDLREGQVFAKSDPAAEAS